MGKYVKKVVIENDEVDAFADSVESIGNDIIGNPDYYFISDDAIIEFTIDLKSLAQSGWQGSHSGYANAVADIVERHLGVTISEVDYEDTKNGYLKVRVHL